MLVIKIFLTSDKTDIRLGARSYSSVRPDPHANIQKKQLAQS